MPANPSSGSAAIKLQKSDFQASNKSYVAIFSIRLFFEKVEGGHPTAFQRVSSEVRFPNLLHRSEWVDKAIKKVYLSTSALGYLANQRTGSVR